jgi:hypothetical protein
MNFNKLIVLTGHRKSGTSVFHKLFDGHPHIYVYPTDICVLYAYFPYFTTLHKTNPSELKTRLKLVLIKSLSKIYDLLKGQINIEHFADNVCNDLKDDELLSKEKVIFSIANNWIKHYYKSQVKKPFLFKETSQSVFFHEFLSFNTEIKMISLVRDPRDNYAAIKAGVKRHYSKLNENELESLASVINRARMDLLSAKNNQLEFESDFMALKFEELTSNAWDIMQSVARFLEIDFSDTLLEPTVLDTNYKGNSHEGIIFKGLSAENVGKWSLRITEDEAKIIEYWLLDVMQHWGYETKYSINDAEKCFADFYNWYNSRYFYRDSFVKL